VESIAPEVQGLFLDRVQVPERPGGFQKSEWALQLSGRHGGGALTFSVRAQAPHLAWYPGKGPKAAPEGTRSAFDLSLGKLLRGVKLQRIHVLPGDRVVFLDWEGDLRLALVLIPAGPEAVLIERGQVVARSRYPERAEWSPPAPRTGTGKTLAVREDWIHSPEAYRRVLDAYYAQHAFETRLSSIERNLSAQLKQNEARIAQARIAREEAEKEPRWQHLGDLLKSVLHLAEENWPNVEVFDYEQDRTFFVECDPDLKPQEQLDRYYQKAKRQKRKIEETSERISELEVGVKRLKAALQALTENPDEALLDRIEAEFQLKNRALDPLTAKIASKFGGKSYVSQDGWTILVGRSREENLELTFRVARGNDLWMHVRGKPSAHVLVLIPPGKHAPLETLLDAANLLLHASSGAQWGKTEVDYTFRKFVKKIPGSTQVSYTHNKTLLVTPDPERIGRLLAQHGMSK
jgi:hypothetical protein